MTQQTTFTGFPTQKSGGNYTQHKGIQPKKEGKRNTYLCALVSARIVKVESDAAMMIREINKKRV
ncbi:Uncharacterized protein TCM_029152 [Theobroma cacao]|uniref:Uncharacterized protein n=1 Tax=Theobroma cacao TaxID=3641 RepID=A0A061GBN8_THECC|nr:Uncharacterized protein TCM_029152 [Theobroma cacao]